MCQGCLPLVSAASGIAGLKLAERSVKYLVRACDAHKINVLLSRIAVF